MYGPLYVPISAASGSLHGSVLLTNSLYIQLWTLLYHNCVLIYFPHNAPCAIIHWPLGGRLIALVIPVVAGWYQVFSFFFFYICSQNPADGHGRGVTYCVRPFILSLLLALYQRSRKRTKRVTVQSYLARFMIVNIRVPTPALSIYLCSKAGVQCLYLTTPQFANIQ